MKRKGKKPIVKRREGLVDQEVLLKVHVTGKWQAWCLFISQVNEVRLKFFFKLLFYISDKNLAVGWDIWDREALSGMNEHGVHCRAAPRDHTVQQNLFSPCEFGDLIITRSDWDFDKCYIY